MNALFVANFASNTGYAWETIEAVWSHAAGHLAREGVRVHVAYASLSGGQPVQLAPDGVPVLEADYGAARRTVRGLARFLGALRTHRIRLLYLTDQPTWSPLYWLFRMAGVRQIVVHDRTSGDRHAGSAFRVALKRLLHYTPCGADRFIGVSDFVVRRLRDVNGTPAARTYRIHNGIDLRRFHHPDRDRLRQLSALPKTTRVIVFTGRLRSYKGVNVLVDAMQLLQRDGRDVSLVFCGDGPDRAALAARVQERGLQNTVFLGKRGDVADIVAGADVAVVPSTWAEAFGLTVVEAMAAGVPLVATRTGAIPEIAADGMTARLVEPGDHAGLAAAIAWMLDNTAEASTMAHAARERAFSYFDYHRAATQLAAVLLGQPVVEPAASAPAAAATERHELSSGFITVSVLGV